MEPPGQAERLPPLAEAEDDGQEVEHDEARDAEEPEIGQLLPPESGAGEPGKDVIDPASQRQHQEAEHDGDVGHRLGPAVADRGKPGESQREEGEELEDAGQHQEQRTYQEMGNGDAVLISGPEEGPDVCSLGCGQGFPRRGTGRREHNYFLDSFRSHDTWRDGPRPGFSHETRVVVETT